MSIQDKFKLDNKKRTVIPTDYKPKEEENKGVISRIKSKLKGEKPRQIKKEKTLDPMFAWDKEPKIREPRYDYVEIVNIAKRNWVLRKVIDLIIRECTRNYGKIKPRFILKCDKCDEELQSKSEECTVCGGTSFTKPDLKQKKIVDKIIKKPSPNRTFLEFIRTTLYYELAVDDFYWSVVYSDKKLEDLPIEYYGKHVYIEHPGHIFPIMDKYGRLGSDKWFCPKCRTLDPKKKEHDDVYLQEELVKDNSGMYRCKICKNILVQTSYVQRIDGKITARLGYSEIVHGSSSRLAPEFYGNSKIMTLVKLLNTIQCIDDYHYETQHEGKIGGMVFFPKMEQERVSQILKNVDDERKKYYQRDVQTDKFKSRKSSSLIFIGLGEGENAIKIPFLDQKDMIKTFEFYNVYISAVEQLYGVDMMVTSEIGKGSAKVVRTTVEVRRETAKEHQRLFCESFNNNLLPLFGVTDWIWEFNELESKDKLRDAEIRHTNMASAKTAVEAGLNVEVDGDKIKIWGKGKIIEKPEKDHTGQPNTESGVTPSGTSRDRHVPTEISPETGDEVKG